MKDVLEQVRDADPKAAQAIEEAQAAGMSLREILRLILEGGIQLLLDRLGRGAGGGTVTP